MDCDVVIQLDLLSCWLLLCDFIKLLLGLLRVDGKNLMMDYKGDLVSLVIPTIYFNYGYLWLSNYVVLKYALYYDT